MEHLELLQKAKALKEKGFDSYQGIVSACGVARANEILGNLLLAFDLGFNLDDLKTIFKNLSNVEEKKEEPQLGQIGFLTENDTFVTSDLPQVEEQIDQPSEALWQVVLAKYNSFNVRKFIEQYENPSYPNDLEIEDFLLGLGVDGITAHTRMAGASGYVQNKLLALGFERNDRSTLVTLNRNRRKTFPKSKQVLDALLLNLNNKGFIVSYKPVESFKTLQDWLNTRYVLEIGGEIIEWDLPEFVYEELSSHVNSLLIKYSIPREYISKSYSSGTEEFTKNDSLDIGKGFCDILYRDAVTSLYNREIDFSKLVQDFCNMKGYTYTESFETQIYEKALKTQVNGTYILPSLKSVRPFHQIVIYHILMKTINDEKSLKVLPLF